MPTFAMALMVISRALLDALPKFAVGLWLVAVLLHLLALIFFAWFRFHDNVMGKMVPSWFVPPVGIIVADVSFPGVPELLPLAQVLLVVGLVSYAIMLPTMLYRLIFLPQVANAAKPTIAIMAAPAPKAAPAAPAASAAPVKEAPAPKAAAPAVKTASEVKPAVVKTPA